jgi:general secretion pathway protein F
VIALGVWAVWALARPAARRAIDVRLLKLRHVGDLVSKLDTARLARTLGTLVRNGVPLLTALNISRPVLSNRVLADAVEAAAEEVKTGSGRGAAPRPPEVLPPPGGENALDRVLAALVPLLTLLMTALVGGIMLSVLLPIYDLTSAI